MRKTALFVALAALGLGLLGDLLLRYQPWGVNVLLWTIALVAIALRTPRRSWFAAAGALIGAAGFLWRDAETLLLLDSLLLIVFLPLLAVNARGVRVAAAGLVEIGGSIVTTAVQTALGVPQLLFGDLPWHDAPRGGVRGAGVALRGIILAAPPLILFGSLLSSADPQFGKLLRDLFFLDAKDLVLHVMVTTLVAVLCAGFLRSVFLSGEMPRATRPETFFAPIAETNIAIALVDAMFALFVVVQFRYFFGAAPDTLAQYARRGFFELVAVVALVMPMLLVVEWLVDKRNARAVRLFRALAIAQVALVFVIAASAYRRMQLYRDAFGLTEGRVYSTAFMLWMAVLLVWFVVTVLLAGQRQRFAIGVLTTGVVAVVILHALNPDALIVETNLRRQAEGRRAFDAGYAAQLSDDAAPIIIANRQVFDAKTFEQYVRRERTIGWRTWNASRARAIAAVRAYESKATPPIVR